MIITLFRRGYATGIVNEIENDHHMKAKKCGSSPNWLNKDIKKDLKFSVMFGISHDWPGGPFFLI
jgi:hypothetical protein